jgi:hypothetical protein
MVAASLKWPSKGADALEPYAVHAQVGAPRAAQDQGRGRTANRNGRGADEAAARPSAGGPVHMRLRTKGV